MYRGREARIKNSAKAKPPWRKIVNKVKRKIAGAKNIVNILIISMHFKSHSLKITEKQIGFEKHPDKICNVQMVMIF